MADEEEPQLTGRERQLAALKKYHFKKGESPNPGGQSAQHAAQARLNALKALQLREKFLLATEMAVDNAIEAAEASDASPANGVRAVMDQNTLKLLKDSEDRGLGTPTQSVKMEGKHEVGPPRSITRRIVDPVAGLGDPDAEVGDTTTGD